jgi:tRNA A37 methylthiotransferase MiaB
LASLVGREESVLVEGPGRGSELSGRSERNEIVHVQAGEFDPTGRVVKVRIERAFNNSLFGVLVDGRGLPRSALRGEAAARRALPMLSS